MLEFQLSPDVFVVYVLIAVCPFYAPTHTITLLFHLPVVPLVLFYFFVASSRLLRIHLFPI